MNEKRKCPIATLVLYCMLLLFTSCEIPVVERPVMQSIISPPIIEELEMIIKPITEYQNYVVSNGNVKGISGRQLLPVVFADENEDTEYKTDLFFVKDGTVYFSITRMEGEETPEEVLHCYSQKDGIVAEFAAYADFPEIPPSTFATMEAQPFKIETVQYNGDDVSNVFKDRLRVGYMQVDGYSVVESGMFYSVSIGTSITPVGVYFWDINSQGNNRKCDGRIW